MKRKSVIFIAGVFIILLVSSGIFVNDKMNLLLSQSSGLLPLDDRDFTNSKTTLPANSPDESGMVTETLPSKSEAQSALNHGNSQLDASSSSNEIKVSEIETRIGQPIARQDVIKAGFILMRKLSAEDIRYLKNVAMQDSCSREEYQRSQEILLDKLSTEDINTLKKLGKKYGSELKILTPNSKS